MSRLASTAARRVVAVAIAVAAVAGGLAIAVAPAAATPIPSPAVAAFPARPAASSAVTAPIAAVAPSFVTAPSNTAAATTSQQLPIFGGTSVASSSVASALPSSTASSAPVLAALAPPAKQTVTRIVGVNPLEIAISVSQHSFPTEGSAGAVVLASSTSFADALSAAPLTAAHDAPLLLTPGTALDPTVATEMIRVLNPGGSVYILGGNASISPAVASAVAADGFRVIRLGGADRYATAIKVADSLGDPSTVLLASGVNFPDGLTGSVAAAQVHGALLLTAGSYLPPEVATYLKSHAGKVTAIGGPASMADKTAIRIVGADRYATAAMVAAKFFSKPTAVGVTSGADFPDGLSAATQLAHVHGPLVLSPVSELAVTSTSYLRSISATAADIAIYGGTDVLRDNVAVEIDSAVIESSS
jgi:putative cell wall-binding protein